ncbi:Cell death abnormality protein 8 [Aphelenchoides besseyi]|nr:Cell death abnormality protein 8 [Aphelenchoides besseyi]
MTSSRVTLRTKTAVLFNLIPRRYDDESDRIPSSIRVGLYDVGCYLFGVGTYVLDMGLDIGVAIGHYQSGRMLAAALTAVFVVVPSFLMNIISFLWFVDDKMKAESSAVDAPDVTEKMIMKESLRKLQIGSTKKRYEIEVTETDVAVESNTNELLIWSAATILQVAPLLWYWKALKSAFQCIQVQKFSRRERVVHQGVYYRMIEADRDASVLRFFEALLESCPQLMIQGYFLMHDFCESLKTGVETDWQLRAISMTVSLVCIAFSFVGHHRALRVCMPDKQNLNITECHLILAWRFLTIFGRFTYVVLVVYFHARLAAFLGSFHLFVTLIHITFLQRLQSGSGFDFLDKLMIGVNICIHIFAPFNMCDGKTGLRYTIGYALEILEGIFIFFVVNFEEGMSSYPFNAYITIIAAIVYVIGLVIMSIYFVFAHPTLHAREEEFNQRDSSIKKVISA